MEDVKLKPGVKTTEFWLAIGAQLIPVLVIAGVLTADEAAAAQNAVVEAVKVISSLVISMLPILSYVNGRAKVKASQNGNG